ncbi:hypothetical protein K488DRAFT_82599 [Vararia minispora EC-137]|uniref:Uncharacterized protein n=1 Tax=Vararia minispora EC-137 TaxID=1314806 RepID=A0ACB8QWB8_9AGAM|nr:hypothetical protein K488DRAFT_82599 [Vararia minispora EC-137]
MALSVAKHDVANVEADIPALIIARRSLNTSINAPSSDQTLVEALANSPLAKTHRRAMVSAIQVLEGIIVFTLHLEAQHTMFEKSSLDATATLIRDDFGTLNIDTTTFETALRAKSHADLLSDFDGICAAISAPLSLAMETFSS